MTPPQNNEKRKLFSHIMKNAKQKDVSWKKKRTIVPEVIHPLHINSEQKFPSSCFFFCTSLVFISIASFSFFLGHAFYVLSETPRLIRNLAIIYLVLVH